MSDKIEIVMIKGDKMYKCQKCKETSKRRYNVERHYRRFHEKMMVPKTCCGITFGVKSDFYDHKEKVHDEKKKYTKKQNQETSKFFKVEQRETVKTEISAGFSETQNNNEIPRLLGKKTPKKYFMDKWQNNVERVPFENLENKEIKRKPHKENILSNSLSSKKENVKIHIITARSMEDMDKELYSIKF